MTFRRAATRSDPPRLPQVDGVWARPPAPHTMIFPPLTVRRRSALHHRFRGLALAVAAGLSLLAPLRAEDAVSRSFDIAASNAEIALKQFSAQSGQQVLVPSELVAGVRTQAVRGEFTPRVALDRMLAGTRLVAVADETGWAFAIVRRTAKPSNRPPLNAAAIIVVGLAADDAQEQRLRRDAEAARDGLVARGIPDDAIALVGTSGGTAVRRDAIFAAMRAVKPKLDETWLILLGNAAPGRDGAPTFQVSGPRLSAEELAGAVGALPGRKFVVLSMARSGAFLPALLPLANVEAVAATAETGEINEPRFTQMWIEALSEHPDASFRDLAAGATARVEKFYRENALGQSEHAQFIDRAAGQIVAVPEPEVPQSPPEPRPTDPSSSPKS
jgi:hypothetical protein